MNIFPKKSTMVMLTAYMSLWLVVVMIAGNILDGYTNTINTALGLKGYRVETSNIEGEDLEYFKSNYVQYNEDGSIKYVTDENGYTHQAYDDAALRADAIEKANQVQREGTTILWNSDDNGLPLDKGDKVSLFSHSSVDWVYSGGGSGTARTNGASDMKKALTNAGLEINSTLWNFYKTGAGKDYVRNNRTLVNEVPWSKYTSSVKDSFASFGDAAIIVLSRQGREGTGSTVHDLLMYGADTPSGDYLDLSKEERDMINEVVALKNAGTFGKVIVLLNTPTDLWLAPLLEIKDDIDCCMWVGQTGYQGLNEVGKILVGDSIPSGHLVNTFLQNTRSNPASVSATMYTNSSSMGLQSVGYQGTYNVYLEGIYLGYKYYETRYEDAVMGKGNATSTAGAVNSKSDWTYGEEVAFPFGYGASYTSFQYSGYNVTENDEGDYVVTLTVKNIGSVKGADAVQIYVQRPYTDYDVLWGIEQSSVNLVGYAKTKELAPGESVDVTITVRDDAFKTYDAYNKKTYIREKGDYYIVAAQDAHDAVNNILAAKGYSPNNTNGVMDAQGNADLTKKFSFENDDYETFSVSEITGNPITNQFDNADWNLYASRAENETVTYLSRNDWQATYPTTIPKLSLTDKMVEDLAYNHEIVEDPNAKMPLYGQEHVFNLIDLKGYDYNHSAWDTLLDQLTFDEMVNLLSTAYHGTKEIVSIAKPAELTKDGPLGIRNKYLNSNEYALSYPSTTILAATYNDKLALEVGELMGEDMLHAGITGLYGTGANIHRTSYSSRNWEYYSEDGFISGMMAKWQVKGIQSKGCYVNLKHFVLNDQETNRHGVSTFANEQTIREIYLAAFEYTVTEGDCTGLMTAFNRVGTSWSGAHKGLCTEVLRNEWGFDGFVISDCRWQVYMGAIDGVLAGNDCVLDNIDVANYEAARTSPTAASAIRESVHRILYVTVNSNAMNGLSSNTKIIQVKEWWQVLVEDVQSAIAVITGVLLLLTILTFIFRRGSDFGEKNIVVTIISMVIAVAIAVVSIGVPVVLNSLPMNFMSEEQENDDDTTGGGSTDDDIIEDDRILSKFEAECAELTASNSKTQQGTEGKGAAATNNPSGGAFIHNLENSDTFTVTFRIHSPEAKEAALILCMGRREMELKVADMFNISVNGEALAISSDLGYSVNTGTKYFDWTELEVATINLKEGENVITFTRGTSEKIMNFDYLGLKCDIALQYYSEVQNGGHTRTTWNMVEEPTLTKEGKISSYCDTCRDYVEESIPAISESNGYTRTIISDGSSQFVRVKWTFTKDSSKFDFVKTEYPSDAKSYVFEAESAEFGGSARKDFDVIYGASGGFYIGQMNNNQSYITLDIYAEDACEALLLIGFGCRTDKSIVFNNGRTLTLNGATVSVPNESVFTKSVTGPNWLAWGEFEIVTLNLREGRNTLTITNNAKEFSNVDYFKLISVSEISWYVDEEHDHNDSDNDHYCNICYEVVSECGDSDGDKLCDICKKNLHAYDVSVKFEAEGAEIVSNSYRTGIGTEGKGAEKTGNPSGDAFIHNLENATEFSVTFKIYSPKAQKAALVLCMGRREKELKVADMFDIWVNGNLLQVSSDVGFGLYDSILYYDWTELEVATIDLKEGENVITFTRNVNEQNVLNFDYILIKSEEAVEDTREKNNGHSYDLHVVTAPTYTTAGTAGGYCQYCRDYKTIVLPAVSSENGYTKLCDGASSLWKYTFSDGKTINVPVSEDVEKDTYTFMISADSNPFAGEFGTATSMGTGSKFALKNNQYYEKTYNATFTTKVTVSERTVVTFIIKIKGNADLPATCDQLFPSIKVNGSVDGVSTFANPSGAAGWSTTADAYVATIVLEAGTNVIEFTRDGTNINILGVAFESAVPVTLGGTSEN